MRAMIARIFTIAFFAGLASTSGASIIGNGPPNQSGGSNLNDFLEADDFTLSASTTLDLIRFWSLQGVPGDYAGSIEWSIRQDAAGAPGAVSASGTTAAPAGVATGNTTLGLNEFRYQFSINVPLTAGNYWLVLHNGPNNKQSSTDFYWAWSSDTGNSQNLELPTNPASQWISNEAELAFQLEARSVNPAPEPASIILVGVGMAAMMARRRYQTRRAG